MANAPDFEALKDINSTEELETMVFGYLDVLDRTRQGNLALMEFLGTPEDRVLLVQDNLVLMDLRNRIWKQFRSVLVGNLN